MLKLIRVCEQLRLVVVMNLIHPCLPLAHKLHPRLAYRLSVVLITEIDQLKLVRFEGAYSGRLMPTPPTQ